MHGLVIRGLDAVTGTFHKAYLLTLSPPTSATAIGSEVVLRVARPFLSKIKITSEVATLHFLRSRTSIPVPEVYCWDADPFNRVGGEWIIMEKVSKLSISNACLLLVSAPHIPMLIAILPPG